MWPFSFLDRPKRGCAPLKRLHCFSSFLCWLRIAETLLALAGRGKGERGGSWRKGGLNFLNENSDARDGAPEKTNPKLLQLFVPRCSLILRAERARTRWETHIKDPWKILFVISGSTLSSELFTKAVHTLLWHFPSSHFMHNLLSKEHPPPNLFATYFQGCHFTTIISDHNYWLIMDHNQGFNG